jgi:hypothetical protein
MVSEDLLPKPCSVAFEDSRRNSNLTQTQNKSAKLQKVKYSLNTGLSSLYILHSKRSTARSLPPSHGIGSMVGISIAKDSSRKRRSTDDWHEK